MNKFLLLPIFLMIFIGCSRQSYYKISIKNYDGLHDSCRITGYTLMKKGNEPFVGTSILVVTTVKGAVSDTNGKFELTVPAGKYKILADYMDLALTTKEIVCKPNQIIIVNFFL